MARIGRDWGGRIRVIGVIGGRGVVKPRIAPITRITAGCTRVCAEGFGDLSGMTAPLVTVLPAAQVDDAGHDGLLVGCVGQAHF